MKEELNAVLIEMLKKTQSGIERGVDFIIEQAPEVVKELLVYNFIENVLLCSFLLIFFLISFFGFLYSLKKNRKEDWREDSTVALLIIFGILLISSSVVFSTEGIQKGLDAIKIKVAPRIYLIEYCSKLVKK